MDILKISKPHYDNDRIIILKGNIYSHSNSYLMAKETSCNFTKKNVSCICIGYNSKIITNSYPIIGSEAEYMIETLKEIKQ